MLYDPVNGSHSAIQLHTPRYGAASALLADGSVLVASGGDGNDSPLESAELLKP